MANITAATSYTVNYKRRLGNSKVYNNVSVVFGNGTLTYAVGGFALSGGSMGCPNNIESVQVVSNTNSGYMARWNQATGNLLLFRTGATSTVAVEATGDIPAAQTVVVEVLGW